MRGIWLDAGMVVSPGEFETMGEFLHGPGAAGAPDNNSEQSCTDATDHPQNVPHTAPSPLLLIPLLYCSGAAGVAGFFELQALAETDAPAVANVGWMQGTGAWMGARVRLHFVDGFGSVWTGAGNWDTAGGEDGGVGG